MAPENLTKAMVVGDHTVLIDASAVPLFEAVKWNVVTVNGKGGSNRYLRGKRAVETRFGLRVRTVYFHRELMFARRGEYVDHVNGDTLDNRRANLRLVDQSSNGGNVWKTRPSTSKYKGVMRTSDSSVRPWRATIRVHGVSKHLGYFDTEERAARAYDAAAVAEWQHCARTNFPVLVDPFLGGTWTQTIFDPKGRIGACDAAAEGSTPSGEKKPEGRTDGGSAAGA